MPSDYPRMLYADSGPATLIVKSAEEEQAAGAGWNTSPSDAHRTPAAVAVPPLASGQEAFIEAVAQRTADIVVATLSKTPAPPPPVEASPPAKPSRALKSSSEES